MLCWRSPNFRRYLQRIRKGFYRKHDLHQARKVSRRRSREERGCALVCVHVDVQVGTVEMFGSTAVCILPLEVGTGERGKKHGEAKTMQWQRVFAEIQEIR